MIFKHEFIVSLTPPDPDYIERRTKHEKYRCECELGVGIGEVFGWEELQKPPHLHSEETRHRLEIIAFTMKDWALFRQRLNHFFPNRELDTILYDLEYGNPEHYEQSKTTK